MKMSKVGYFGEFLVLPMLILIAIVLAFQSSSPPRPAIWATVFGVGLICWTLIEYLVHRIVFHHAPILSRIHERHHQSPRELIGTPAWASLLAGVIGIACPCWVGLGFNLATAATAGIFTGYLWYVFVHYTTHHWQHHKPSYLYRARVRHARHHYVSHRKNFGVTTSLWDHFFGTAFDPSMTVRTSEYE